MTDEEQQLMKELEKRNAILTEMLVATHAALSKMIEMAEHGESLDAHLILAGRVAVDAVQRKLRRLI